MEIKLSNQLKDKEFVNNEMVKEEIKKALANEQSVKEKEVY